MRTLKMCWALIRKDIKSISGFAGILFLLMPFIVFWLKVSDNVQLLIYTQLPYARWVTTFFHAEDFMFVAILAVVFNIEWGSSARFMLLDIPVRRGGILLSKVTAVLIAAYLLSFCTVYFGLLPWGPASLWVVEHLYHHDISTLKSYQLIQIGTLSPNVSDYFPFWNHPLWNGFFNYREPLFLYGGMVCFAQGVMVVINRYRFAVWVFSFLAAVCLYALVKNGIIVPLVLHDASWGHFSLVKYYNWEAGMVFLLAGLFLFDRYAEV